MEPEPPRAASFCLELEPTQVGRSRSQLRDLGHQEPEPEPPKKVAAPQHCWFYDNKTVLKHILESIIITGLTSLTERRQPLPMAF